MDNLTAVLHGIDDLRIEQTPIPTPKKGQLLIRIHTVGICGSDVHYWTNGAIGPFVVKAPMIIGHETSGTVEALGEGVHGFAVGDRVALEPGIPCRMCDHCKTGSYNLCPDVIFFATPPYDGSIRRFLAHDADFCFKLPDNVTYEEGALLEPLSVGLHACRRGRVTAGQRVLVLGAGTIGVMSLLTAKAHGVAKTFVTDIDDGRLALAKELGADHILNVRGLRVEEVAAKVHEALGRGPDLSIECTGAASSIETGMVATRSGGTLVLVGLGAPRVEVPIVDAAVREVDIRGVFRYANCYATALEMVATGKVDLKKLTRAHYTLEETVEAFKRAKKADVTKVFIKCAQE